jgi:dipeptidyl aminopeptidase/acylaminoacyl peptidase
MRTFTLYLFLLFITLGSQAQQQKQIQPEDIYRMKSVGKPQLSPDGQWILYSVSRADSSKDRYQSKLYMMSTSSDEIIQLTDERSAGAATWSPDNRYISFLSKGKREKESSQLFLMNRKGGEPQQLTHIKGEIGRYKWFEDGQRILMEIRDPRTADTAKTNVRKPYEINRFHFKDDSDGYLDNRKTHLYVYDIERKKLDTLTKGDRNETGATVSKQGNYVAFVRNATEDPDRNANSDIFLLELSTRKIEQITNYPGPDNNPQFSPDGTMLSFSRSTGQGNFTMYDISQLHLYSFGSKSIRNISAMIDRSVDEVNWAPDSKYIYSIVEDDRKQNIVIFDILLNTSRQLTNEMGVYSSISVGQNGHLVSLYSDVNTPNEIYMNTGGVFRRMSHINDAFVKTLNPIYVKGIEAMSIDKNNVSGILYLPDSTSRNLPLVLFIHGGPVAQDDYAFDMSRQVLAGAGFAVAAVNYRGSSGRGINYTKTIYGDWGNKEVKDIIAIANQLIKDGIADANRLGIGGWSYGGILTNYTIATDSRFKAAVSGAGSSLQLSLYGSDQYITQYEEELGKPWKNPKKWLDLSYPFFKVEQIKTPTLFMASEDDFNVPVIGAEQMYQAFKSIGIPTELIIYPNQHHGLRVPSYVLHRYKKHIEWYRKYLN